MSDAVFRVFLFSFLNIIIDFFSGGFLLSSFLAVAHKCPTYFLPPWLLLMPLLDLRCSSLRSSRWSVRKWQAILASA